MTQKQTILGRISQLARANINALLDRAEKAGARIGDTDDYGFMNQRQLDDPEGYHYSPFWAEPEHPASA